MGDEHAPQQNSGPGIGVPIFNYLVIAVVLVLAYFCGWTILAGFGALVLVLFLLAWLDAARCLLPQGLRRHPHDSDSDDYH